MPTFVELTDAPTPRYTDCISFLPTLLGQGNQQQHPYLYWEFHEGTGKQAVRMGKWKGIRLNAKENPDARLALYDLQTDPAETTDVAATHPEIAKQLGQMMAEAHQESALFPLFPYVKPMTR